MMDIAALEQWIRTKRELDGTPALGIAITNRDETIYLNHFGHANLDAMIPAGPEHAFENGSIGKSFTALVLLKLHEQGLINLQAPVARYLPWFEAGGSTNSITLHHLLTHSSGIIEGTDIAADGRFEAWSLRDQPVLGAPGEHFSYSNVGYKVLGYVIEEVVGSSYSEVVTKEVLEPLGMNESFSPITDLERNRLAVGYRFALRDRPWRKEHGLVPDSWIETGTGDGSIAVTTADMARYTRATLNRGAGLISDESFALMIGDLAPREAGDDSTYGYGLMTFEIDGHRLYGHDGGMLGYYSSMVCDPEAGIGVCTLVNGPGQEDVIAHQTLAFIRARITGAEPYTLPDVPPHRQIDEASELAGVYANASDTWKIVSEGSALYLDRPEGRVAIERYRGTRYLLLAPDLDRHHLIFERGEDNAVTALHHGPRWMGREGRCHEEPPVAPEYWRAFAGVYQGYNPWQQRFEIFLRRGELWFNMGSGHGGKLIEIEPGHFQIGESPSAERIRFDAIAQGQALRAELNGQGYYRTLWASLPSTRR